MHLGHSFLVDQAIRLAREGSGASIALAFSVDPDELFAADCFVKLMANEERILALVQTGVDAVVVLPFDRAFASLSPEEFLELAFGERTPTHLHVGEGFGFGRRGTGGIALIEEWGSCRGMESHCHDLLAIDGGSESRTCSDQLQPQLAKHEGASPALDDVEGLGVGNELPRGVSGDSMTENGSDVQVLA